MAFRVTVIGADLVVNKLRRIAARLPKGVDKMTEDLAKIASKEAKKNIKPRFKPSSGALKSGIRAGKAKDGKWFVTVRGKAGRYAEYVEFGTGPSTTNYPRNVFIPGKGWRRMSKHPGAQGYPSQFFMRRAFKRAVRATKPIVRKRLKEVIR